MACETATKTGMVMVFGEITTKAKVNYEEIVRKTCKGIGFTSEDVGLDADTCKVLVHIEEQSPDIGQGVHGMGTKTLEETGAGVWGLQDSSSLQDSSYSNSVQDSTWQWPLQELKSCCWRSSLNSGMNAAAAAPACCYVCSSSCMHLHFVFDNEGPLTPGTNSCSFLASRLQSRSAIIQITPAIKATVPLICTQKPSKQQGAAINLWICTHTVTLCASRLV